MRRIKELATVVSLVLLLGAAAHAADTPSATLELSGGSVGAGVGIDWGSGTLRYNGKKYPISVKGLTVGDVGITKVSASGTVFGLKKLEDFNGNYTAVEAGATAAGGGGITEMKNQNGVRVRLVSTTQGAQLNLGASGVDVSIEQ